jgi:P-type E1-E2 ATPase
MIVIDVPDFGTMQLEYLVLDYNGTLAVDGHMQDGVAQILKRLSEKMEVHVVTADTFGRAAGALENVPCRLAVLPEKAQAQAKREFIQKLGFHRCVCIGNGRNDNLMLKSAALGIAVILAEGASSATLQAADIVANDIVGALELLENPLRIVATLRS